MDVKGMNKEQGFIILLFKKLNELLKLEKKLPLQAEINFQYNKEPCLFSLFRSKYKFAKLILLTK